MRDVKKREMISEKERIARVGGEGGDFLINTLGFINFELQMA